MELTDRSSDDFFTIENNKFFVLKNVKKYLPSKRTYSSVEIEYFNTERSSSPKHIYFLIDSPSHMAVGHWFFESAIFVPYLKEIQERFPTIIIHLLEKKNYKLLLLNYFGYSTNISYDSLEEDNICIIPSPVQSVHLSEYYELFKNNVEKLYTFCNFPILEKDCDILIMPRQTKENFKGNDRNYDAQFKRLHEKMPDSKALHTDSIENFIDQVIQVRKSKKIYLSDGSAFLLNGFIAFQSEIYVVDRITITQAQRFKRYRFLLECIQRTNKVIRL
jgi:hypothetical protein